jgi:tRNA-splicing ligase RtcB
MVHIKDFEKESDYEWVIPKGFRKDMRVPVRLFASRNLLEDALKDKSIEQAINSAALPGLVDEVKVMPDVHQGYGFPIGGVAGTIYPQGVISPGGIGYDINCGVRLLGSSIRYEEAAPYLDNLATELDLQCPSGVGTKGNLRLDAKELRQVLEQGARWLLKNGMATEMDLQRTENNGSIDGVDAETVSSKAMQRGAPQLGTLGAGNHFIEVGIVDQVFDPEAARIMGLEEGMITLMVHSGSRGFGHQVCTDYVQDFQAVVQRYGIKLPDRELVCAARIG